MKIFATDYDLAINSGMSSSEAFSKSIEIFKTCYPFRQLAESDWKKVCDVFTKLAEPKNEFLKLMLRPSRQLVICFKNQSFLEEFLSIKKKYGLLA